MKLNFTRKAIDALPLPLKQARVYHYDTVVRGLAVGIGSTGRKTFVLYRKVNGRPERITLGPYPDLSIEQARGLASEHNASIARGENPNERRRAIREEMTVEELFEMYLERYCKIYKKSWREDAEQYRRYLPRWGKKKISMIRKSDVASLHATVGQENGPYAANRLIALVRAMFNQAKQWGWTGDNPAAGIKKFRERSRERFLQADEFPAFFKALSEEPNGTIRDYILLSLLTGARRSNVMAMRWSELNLERGTWNIPETKGGDPFIVTLSTPAIEILRQRGENVDSDWVFPGDGKTGHLVEPKTSWQRILKRAGITDLRLHDLRRTLGSWEAATGASLSIIGRSLAHKNVATTAVYARLSLDPVRQAVDRATHAMLQAAGVLPGAGNGSKEEKAHESHGFSLVKVAGR